MTRFCPPGCTSCKLRVAAISLRRSTDRRRSPHFGLLLLAVLPDHPRQVTAFAVLHDNVEHCVCLVDEALDVAYDVVVLVEVLENVTARQGQSQSN